MNPRSDQWKIKGKQEPADSLNSQLQKILRRVKKKDSKDETEVALEEGGMSVGRKEGKALIGAREVRALK